MNREFNDKVSVVIPTFNRVEYIGSAIESVLSQTVSPLEVVVIDDGSTDGTGDLVRSRFPGVAYKKKDNGGKSSALNLVMPELKGEYVWVFDDDDVALPDALHRHLQILENSTALGFTYSSFLRCREDSQGRLVPFSESQIPNVRPQKLFLTLLDSCSIAHPAILVRRRCYQELGPFDERLVRSQDYDMLLRLAYNYLAEPIEGPTFHCRQHSGVRGTRESQISSKEVSKNWLKYDRLILQKYYPVMSLSEYVDGPRQVRDLSDEERLTAVLRRMSIVARKGEWQLFINDLEEALANASGITLSGEQASLCHIAMQSKLDAAYDEFVGNRECLRKVRSVCRGEVGSAVRRELAKGMIYESLREWRIEQRMRSIAILQAAATLLGTLGVLGLLGAKLLQSR